MAEKGLPFPDDRDTALIDRLSGLMSCYAGHQKDLYPIVLQVVDLLFGDGSTDLASLLIKGFIKKSKFICFSRPVL